MKGQKKIRESINDKIFMRVIYLFLILILIVVLYPLIYVVSASFSNPADVAAGRVVLFPVNPTMVGYDAVLKM